MRVSLVLLTVLALACSSSRGVSLSKGDKAQLSKALKSGAAASAAAAAAGLKALGESVPEVCRGRP